MITFSIDSAGTYTVGGGFPEGRAGSFFIFALGKSTSGPLIVAVLSIIGGLGGGIVLLWRRTSCGGLFRPGTTLTPVPRGPAAEPCGPAGDLLSEP